MTTPSIADRAVELETTPEQRAAWLEAIMVDPDDCVFHENHVAMLLRDFTKIEAAAREDERAKIVAWLRERAGPFNSDSYGSIRRNVLLSGAVAIERVDHLPPAHKPDQSEGK